MSEEILSLKPAGVWKFFHEITQVPRPSKKEAKIREYLLATGKKMGLETLQDAAGNVLIRKPATKGKENVTPVIFQAHMDMVCEKNADTKFDLKTMPFKLI